MSYLNDFWLNHLGIKVQKWRENGVKTARIYEACLKGVIPSRTTIFRHANHTKQTTQTFAMIALYFFNDTLT